METVSSGKIKEISSISNPIVKDIKSLALKKNREKKDFFITEGLKFLIEGLELGWRPSSIMVAKNQFTDPLLQKTLSKAFSMGAMVIKTSEKVLCSITRRENSQSVLAVFQRKFHPLETLSFENAPVKKAGTPITSTPVKRKAVYLALDRVRDPGNLGSIIRTADAVGAKGVILIGECTDPYSMEAVRATMGSIFAVPLYRITESAFITWRKHQKARFLGTYLKGAVDYRKADHAQQSAVLLMGNEQQGLSDNLASICDQLIKIPQIGRADSLNLSVATGLMLYESLRDHLELPA